MENFKINNLDQDKFSNRLPYKMKEVTNPVLFSMNNVPSSDGLLSNEIFGVSPKDRKYTFAYIDLRKKFFHPSIFEQLERYSNKFSQVASSAKKFKIVNNELVEDENGNTGLDWLIDNFKKLKFDDKTESIRKNILGESLNNYSKFMDKLIVIPPFYRDVDTSKGLISVGKINELYIDVLRLTKSLESSDIYGDNLYDSIRYKLQLKIVEIFNYFMDIKYPDSSDTVLGKEGIIYRTMYRKSLNYTSRLVLCQPDNNKDHWNDLDVTVDQTLVPLDSAATQLFPFVVFEVKNILHKFKNGDKIMAFDKNYNEVEVTISKDIESYYDDDQIEKYIKRFIKSISIRFTPVYIPNDENKDVYLIFESEYMDGEKIKRKLTWTDVIFIATTRAAKNKHMISTRYPVDTAYNQIINRVKVASTLKTKKMMYQEELYDYPVIKRDDVDTDTSNLFKEVCNISNAAIPAMGGDYDGDTSNNKILFSDEANVEAEEYMNSLRRSININGSYIYEISAESYIAGYSLTKDTGEEQLGVPVF